MPKTAVQKTRKTTRGTHTPTPEDVTRFLDKLANEKDTTGEFPALFYDVDDALYNSPEGRGFVGAALETGKLGTIFAVGYLMGLEARSISPKKEVA